MTSIPFTRTVAQDQLNAAVASVAPLSEAVADARADAGDGALVFAWLSDIHIQAPVDYGEGRLLEYGTRVDTSAESRIALAEIAALTPRPDALIIGGDIGDTGWHPDMYEQELPVIRSVVTSLLPPGVPIFPILGNHDFTSEPIPDASLNKLRFAFPGAPATAASGDYVYTAPVGGWRVIALDSRADIGDAQRRWLRDTLAADNMTPTVILTHRPWVTVSNWVDEMRLFDNDALATVQSAANTRLVLSGHTHRRAAWKLGPVVHAVFPANAYGIDDVTGWGVVVLGRDHVEAVFVKELATHSFESNSNDYIESAGKVDRLEPMPFEPSDPAEWPAF